MYNYWYIFYSVLR